MKLQLVAANPDAPPQTECQRALRKLRFAQAAARCYAHEGDNDERRKAWAGLAGKIEAAISLLEGLS